MREAITIVVTSTSASLLTAAAILCIREAFRAKKIDEEEIERADMRSLSWPSKDAVSD
jgi:hypothetical protein